MHRTWGRAEIDAKVARHLLDSGLAHSVFNGIGKDRRWIGSGIRGDRAVHAGKQDNASAFFPGHGIADFPGEQEGRCQGHMIGFVKFRGLEILNGFGKGPIGHNHQTMGNAAIPDLRFDKSGHRIGISGIQGCGRDAFCESLAGDHFLRPLIEIGAKDGCAMIRQQTDAGRAQITRAAHQPDIPALKIEFWSHGRKLGRPGRSSQLKSACDRVFPFPAHGNLMQSWNFTS